MSTLLPGRFLTLAAATLLTTLLAACASAGGRTEGPTLAIDLQVNNNLVIPTDLSVYAIRQGGARALVGNVPPGASRTFKFKPVAFSEPYRLIAIRPNGRMIRSQTFTVGSDMTGAINWTLVPNIVGFENFESDTLVAPDSLDRARSRDRVIP
jgi:hypothetical protein